MKVLYFLFVPFMLFAYDDVSIIDPDNAAGTDYTSIGAWESGEQRDITTGPGDTIATAECRSTGGTADPGGITVTGWTVDATAYLKIWTNPDSSYRHDGTYSTGNKFRIEYTGTGNAIYAAQGLTRYDGIQIKCTSSSGGPNAIRFGASSSFYVKNCIFVAVFDGSTSGAEGVQTRGGETLYISNCIWYDWTGGSGGHTAMADGGGTTHFVYNCTIQNSNIGYEDGGGTMTVNNCIAQDCTDGFAGTFSGDYNCSDISSDAPGGNSQTGEVLFADEGNDDFHLGSGDTVAKANGTDLSGDGDLPISDDIDGDTRSAWDIGADGIKSGASPTTSRRRFIN